jgi:DNA-damage-inducible protein J
MAKTSNLSIRTDAEIKHAIEALYGDFGITVSDAVNIFFANP